MLPPPVSVFVCVCFPYLCKMLYCTSAANKDSDSDSANTTSEFLKSFASCGSFTPHSFPLLMIIVCVVVVACLRRCKEQTTFNFNNSICIC